MESLLCIFQKVTCIQSPNICIYLYIYIYIYISKQNLEGPEAEDAAIHICIYIHSLTV